MCVTICTNNIEKVYRILKNLPEKVVSIILDPPGQFKILRIISQKTKAFIYQYLLSNQFD
jgi:hypothetical protein